MNNIVKSVVFAAVVLFAGIAAMQVIYKNTDPSADITAIEPAAGEFAAPGEAPATTSDSLAPVSDVVPSDASVEAQKDAIEAEAEAAKEAVEADVEAAKDEAAAAADAAEATADNAEAAVEAVEENAEAQKDAIEAEADAAKDAVEAAQDAAEKAAE